jgi:hypothetical protein
MREGAIGLVGNTVGGAVGRRDGRGVKVVGIDDG